MAAKRRALSHPAQPRSNLAGILHPVGSCTEEALVSVLGEALLLDPRCASQMMNPK